MKKIFLIPVFALTILTVLDLVSAHCPLCTAGAGAAAAGASWLGVSNIVIGLFIGAFAVSIGMWFGRIIPKQYLPFQKTLIVALSFLLTVLPILYLISMVHPFQVSLFGEYGSLFNRIYMVDLSLMGSILGGALVFISPSISKQISKLNKGKTIPFQGIIITLASLLVAGAIIQFSV